MKDYKQIIQSEYRTHMLKQLDETFIWQTLALTWRILSIRDHWDLVFIDLREDGELFQIKFSRDTFPDLEIITKIKKESVIQVLWKIIPRSDDDINTKIKAWTIEMDCKEIKVLSSSKPLPFAIPDSKEVSESLRLKYRFLDLRSLQTRDAIVKRHQIISYMRTFFDQKDFIEIETPILGKWTDEWAREFIIPSRTHWWKFYTLPQSPQQFKQMCMLSWFDKYYQVARCFRDEDDKWDRQPEFTQLDIEMAFVSQKKVMSLISDLVLWSIKKFYPQKKIPKEIPTMTYQQAMEQYGTDKPDIRFDLKSKDITDIVQGTPFEVFQKVIKSWWIVKCLKVTQDMTKKQVEDLTKLAIQSWLGWLAYITIQADYLQSPIVKFLWEDVCQKIIQKMEAKIWDTIFFSAAKAEIAHKALDIVRRKIWEMLKLYWPDDVWLCRVIDFPMFEKTLTWKWKFTHNPFSMPQIQYLEQFLKWERIEDILAQQYDIIMDGCELWWWSIRAHIPEILEQTYKIMWYKPEEITKSVWHMIDSFWYWVPPHGWIALGLDRFIMLLQKEKTIREVIAFPKSPQLEDLLFQAPSELSSKRLSESHIKIDQYITWQWAKG